MNAPILDWTTLTNPTVDGGVSALASMNDAQLTLATIWADGHTDTYFHAASEGIDNLMGSLSTQESAGTLSLVSLRAAKNDCKAAFDSTTDPVLRFIFADYMSYIYDRGEAAYYLADGVTIRPEFTIKKHVTDGLKAAAKSVESDLEAGVSIIAIVATAAILYMVLKK